MAKNKKVIISCAVTGAIHTPSMSEYLPVTADEVIEHSLAAHEAGAAVLHLHARDEVDGHPHKIRKSSKNFFLQFKILVMQLLILQQVVVLKCLLKKE